LNTFGFSVIDWLCGQTLLVVPTLKSPHPTRFSFDVSDFSFHDRLTGNGVTRPLVEKRAGRAAGHCNQCVGDN
jgi:hypothetical protein